MTSEGKQPTLVSDKDIEGITREAFLTFCARMALGYETDPEWLCLYRVTVNTMLWEEVWTTYVALEFATSGGELVDTLDKDGA